MRAFEPAPLVLASVGLLVWIFCALYAQKSVLIQKTVRGAVKEALRSDQTCRICASLIQGDGLLNIPNIS